MTGSSTLSAAGNGRLAGQVAIVTGAGTGIGRAAAIALAREGASVVLFGRRRKPLESCAEEVQAAGGTAAVQPLDVADERAVEDAVRATVERFGRIDVLVNNAGTNTPRRLCRDSTVDDWRQVVETNLTGVFLVIRPLNRDL